MTGPASPAFDRTARIGAGLTLLAASGFAAVSILTSVAMRYGLSLTNVLTWRYALSALVLVVWVVASGQARRLPTRDMLMWLVVGGGGQALMIYLALSSLAYISAGTLAFLFYTYPVWVTIVQALRGAERLDARRATALALSFGGTAVMVGAPELGGTAARGVALALIAAVIYGLMIPALQWMQKDWPVLVTSAWSKIGAAACFIVASAGDQTFQFAMPSAAWGAIVALTLWSTVLPSVFFLMGLMRLGPVRTAIISTIEPFLTALLGVVVLSQPLTSRTLIGGAAIVAAVIVLQLRTRRAA
ncbi:MAG: DMT family transporter [Gemmatimonadetes bacterium]|nr:DMT family transporter [Gemmatimonadota bacterium]